MRPFGMVLPALVLSALPAFGQATPPGTPVQPAAPRPVPPAGAPDAVDKHLIRWEQEMRKVQTLAAQIIRIDRDKTFETTTKLVGYAHYMKAGSGVGAMNLASLELKVDGKADIAEKFTVTGTFLYQFVPAQKEIRYFELPKPKAGQVADESFLGFLFGMKADEAKRRYDLKLFQEDMHYVYVDVTPRFPEDRADFKRARLVLNKDSFLPRQLWFEHPNGNETTWDLPRLQSGVVLDRRAFDRPTVPTGWKLVQINRNPAPPPGPAPASPGGVPGAAPAPPPAVVRPSGG